MCKKFYSIGLFILLVSCTNNVVNIKNKHEGKLKATHQLVINSEKNSCLMTTWRQNRPTCNLWKTRQACGY
jgi:hypothetical protein